MQPQQTGTEDAVVVPEIKKSRARLKRPYAQLQEAFVSEKEAYDQESCDTEDAEDDDEEHQVISIPDNPDPGTDITKTIPDMLDTRTIIPDMVPDQAEKEVGAENDDQSGDDRGAAISAREASRGRVVEDGGAFMHAFARVLTTGLGIYGALCERQKTDRVRSAMLTATLWPCRFTIHWGSWM
ncbi:hypothetical protein PR002_g28909 [Phytophthora rubi]|uniref:Uncharacterized protein n=1 Tax=Phytophthora rubi TaxID=129364 RepID=A0A6A3H4V2_9STRA|nr:hypothetical protein PR002_g28909 [Phytophthora rubi]